MDIAARATAIAAALTSDDVRAYADPAECINNRPCLLVAPPVLDYGEGTWTTPAAQWRIFALSSYDAGTFAAVQEFPALIARADEVLRIEKATPTPYRLNDQLPPVAAYLCTHTEIED